MRFGLALALVAGVAWGQSATVNGISGQTVLAAGVQGLIPNSSAAASSNAAAINAALAAGGIIHIAGTQGEVYYVDGPLIQYSNSFFVSDPGVILRSNNNT